MSRSTSSVGQTGPPVAVVVVNRNRRQETLRCLEALSELTYAPWSLILVDNGCSDFSGEELEESHPGSTYLRTDSNLGFAGGANLGMRQALRDGAGAIWFLNNDAHPEPEALNHLVAALLQDEATGIAGAKILQAGAPYRLDSVALRVEPGSGRIYLVGHDEEDRGQHDGLSETPCVTACAMLVARSACEALGGFDESFFAYLEDADLCLRARRSGIRVAVAPSARVYHARPPATAARQSVASIYYTTRNHLVLMHRHGSRGIVARAIRPFWIAALNTAYALRAGGPPVGRRLQAVARAIRDYRRGITGAVRHP